MLSSMPPYQMLVVRLKRDATNTNALAPASVRYGTSCRQLFNVKSLIT
jgi:hypothetical protein